MTGDHLDLTALSHDAHALIGTSGNVGAVKVTELARALETFCKDGATDAARAAAVQLAAAADIAAAALTTWVSISESGSA